MPDYRKGSHTVYDIQYHLVWVTKYRYQVLRGEIAERARDIIRQICMSRYAPSLVCPLQRVVFEITASKPRAKEVASIGFEK